MMDYENQQRKFETSMSNIHYYREKQREINQATELNLSTLDFRLN